MSPSKSKLLIMIIMTALSCLPARAQEARESVVVYFRKESAVPQMKVVRANGLVSSMVSVVAPAHFTPFFTA